MLNIYFVWDCGDNHITEFVEIKAVDIKTKLILDC